MSEMYILKQGYQGRPSGEQFIAPGTYAEDDPDLMGLGPYLVNLGFADVLDVPSSRSVEKAEQGDLSSLTKTEIKSRLDDLGASYDESATKAELLAQAQEYLDA